ncbi:Eukaryotic translation initiation factor 4 gamma 3 [Araneus ventricosus]|uniref:Eukaryotic translation initiation factor 4 gamma 3 n=1 Tax=Araneus ventricosus TaxID=182803 RepID=A0A4Y2H201_ARAVE|nr:Eukaryotic translation initiation factor 4 gamma 3 [Araneus ventricosus]
MEPMIEDIENFFKFLKEVLQPCLPSEKADKLLSSILHCAAKRKGTIKFGEIWRESGLQWSDIIGTDRNVAEFLKKHKLEFTVNSAKVNSQPRMSMEEIKKPLLNLLEINAELEEVFDWVYANVSDISSPTFVRALVTAVHESCLSGSGTTWGLNTSKLKSRTPLIYHYVSTNEKLQLQALYAVQALLNQLGQPSGLLHQIFDVLYDDDVISDESFEEWEQSDDPNEAEGKGVAVHSVKSFFSWLREP